MARDSEPVCAPPDPSPRPPGFAVPPGACDTHAHVFGSVQTYAYIRDRSYTPADALPADYHHMLSVLGVERTVLVQPSVYGTDNRCMLDAMADAGPGLRGIAVVDEAVSDTELQRMQDLGVRGLRFNLLFKGGARLEAMQKMAVRVRSLGWHVQILTDVSVFDDLERRLGRLPVDVVVDHMGHMPAAKGIDHPGFQALLALVRDGRAWVKLSGAYRLTSRPGPPYDDVVPFARALIEAAPERMLWATDWPHPAFAGEMPNDGDLLDALADWAPDEALRRRILVENPARLYGYS